MADASKKQKVVIVGAGPVGSLAALYAASRGDDVEIYELRGGMLCYKPSTLLGISWIRTYQYISYLFYLLST